MGYCSPYLDGLYAEEAYTIKESAGLKETPAASATLRCLWANRYVIAQDILTNLRTWPKSGPMMLLPIKNIAIQPAPGSNFTIVDGQCEYAHALLTLNYGAEMATEKDPETGQLYSESLEPRVDYIPLDHKMFFWIPATGPATEIGPVLEGEAPSMPIYSMALKRTLYKLPYIPPVVYSAVGGVNDSTYYSASLGFTAEPETLLYKPPVTKRDISTDGTWSGWTLDLEWVWRPQGWNVFWNGSLQKWTRFGSRNWTGSTVQIDAWKPYPPKSYASILF